jgi:DNA-binding transcriptional MerR regulator
VSVEYLNPSEAARRLGISAKALRLYEQRGLVTPLRTEAGWRVYGPDQMARAAQVAALRRLGLSLAQAVRVLAGDPADLEPALAAHQAALEAEGGRLADLIGSVRALRARLAAGETPSMADLAHAAGAPAEPVVAFDLPWPWGGELFELCALAPLIFLVGPLGSGKTRLAMALAEALPGGRFIGLNRKPGPLTPRAEAALDWLAGEGATSSDALTALMAELEAGGDGPLVVDLVEQGLEAATQEALGAWLRRRPATARPLVLMTRSTAILDLADPPPGAAILYCPANHAPPVWVPQHPGAPGYESVAGCLAPPDVRARTEGMIATLPAV